MVEGPIIHGSMRIENVPGGCWYWIPGGEGGALFVGAVGANVSRKVVSPFRCLTLSDMTPK